MNRELAERPIVVDPVSGEVIDPSDVPRVAAVLDSSRELARNLREFISAAESALLEQMDLEARWTIEAGPWKVTGDSPAAADVVWDLDELHKLEELLPSGRYAECVQTTVTEKAVTGELRKVAKLGGRVAEIVERAEQREPKRRRVSLKRLAKDAGSGARETNAALHPRTPTTGADRKERMT